jgi:cytochrome d ubiquinol oxidase subunit II
MWRAVWDAVFAVASILLGIFFGCALGNLLRGLPLDPAGWFHLALFTDFTAQMPVGILDWYTVLVGVYALLALAMHGGTYLSWKTDGPVQARSRACASRVAWIVAGLWPVMTFLTVQMNPDMFGQFAHRPLAWACIAIAIAGLTTVVRGLRRGADRSAFYGSSAFLLGLMAATAASVYPVMLRSIDNAPSLTALNAGNDVDGLKTALHWWLVGIPLVIIYFAIQFRVHAGKATAAREGEGY